MIHEKLQQARVTLQNKKLKKSGKNQYYDYYELADFIPAINEIFNELKLHSAFNITKEKAILKITDIEDPEQMELYEAPLVKAELKSCTAVQALGATITYLKRYLYMNALEIVESDYLDAKTVQELKQKDMDIDIFEGFKACDNLQNATAYYQEYKDKVTDKKAFNNIAKQVKAKFTNKQDKEKQQ